ncbi:MAG: prepilin-type N-terminal cleavage/methylation domain-containing protein [Myxococcales bacterium]|nr:prepilin-type N-terminal cleavage/methylation domain-containing protein [Myxococcales bacterium]
MKGFSLVELMIVIAIIGILALIAMPNYVNLRVSAYNASAGSSGHNARTEQEIYKSIHNTYAGDLSSLLAIDRNLTDDPEMTFVFGNCNNSGYTFTVKHNRGDTYYRFSK